jgi:DNA helicase-2/ATP-dependent DNA helicase PcrA
MVDFRKELSDIQFKAVTYMDGPELVIAGAGSGKTRVLTYKIAYLLENGIQPSRILALTFTNKAAKEMKKRIASLVNGDAASKLQMGTFHSIFAKILRFEVDYNKELLPYTKNFSIYDSDDSQNTIKEIIEKMGLDPKKYETVKVASKISTAKNNMITPDQYILSQLFEKDKDSKLDKIGEIYKKYSIALKMANAMDFDDLLLNTYLLFNGADNVRRKYANHFQYILVDEYQDTNLIQKEILLQLTKDKNMICAVGDDAQSIYAFRGAVIDNILDFDKDFPDAEIVKLEENYRSTQTIVKAANSVIQKNRFQIFKDLFSNNDTGEPISLIRAANDRGESSAIVNTIKQMVCNEKYSYNDFAILYRSNWLSRSLEEELRREFIPYRIYGGTSFYQRKEVKDLLAYFRLVINPDDEQALRRIINYPTRGLGNTTIAKLVDISVLWNKSIWEIISHPNNLNSFPKGTAKKIIDFVHLVKSWQSYESENAYDIAAKICKESGIVDLLSHSSKPEDSDRHDNVLQVLASVKDFIEDHKNDETPSVTLEDYIREVALLTDEDNDTNLKRECVKLMTVHSSKGLEFPIVFIAGMDDNTFPCRQAYDSSCSYEEERRLFYVALTRAKKKCFLTGACSHFRNGNMQPYEKSPFINDIDNKFVKEL